MKELKNRGIPYKIYLSEDEMPRYGTMCAPLRRASPPPC